MYFCVTYKECVKPSKIAMQPLKRQWEFTHTSERTAELKYWLCDICLEFLLFLVTHDLPLNSTRSAHSCEREDEKKSHLPDGDVNPCWAVWWIRSSAEDSHSYCPSPLYVLYNCFNYLDMYCTVLQMNVFPAQGHSNLGRSKAHCSS